MPTKYCCCTLIPGRMNYGNTENKNQPSNENKQKKSFYDQLQLVYMCKFTNLCQNEAQVDLVLLVLVIWGVVGYGCRHT